MSKARWMVTFNGQTISINVCTVSCRLFRQGSIFPIQRHPRSIFETQECRASSHNNIHSSNKGNRLRAALPSRRYPSWCADAALNNSVMKVYCLHLRDCRTQFCRLRLPRTKGRSQYYAATSMVMVMENSLVLITRFVFIGVVNVGEHVVRGGSYYTIFDSARNATLRSFAFSPCF